MQIIGVNIVLSGDNAVVIALAARSLPPEQQKRAVAWGSGAAVVMRIVLTIVAVELLRLPYLKLVGAALLLWIARPAADSRGRRRRRASRGSTQHGGGDQDDPARRPGDEPGQRDRAWPRRPRATSALLIIGLAISIPAGDLRQPHAAGADGSLPDHHHARRRPARLGRRRHGRHRSGRQGLGRSSRRLPALGRAARGGDRRDRWSASGSPPAPSPGASPRQPPVEAGAGLGDRRLPPPAARRRRIAGGRACGAARGRPAPAAARPRHPGARGQRPAPPVRRREQLRRRQDGRGLPPRAQRPGAGADPRRCSRPPASRSRCTSRSAIRGRRSPGWRTRSAAT